MLRGDIEQLGGLKSVVRFRQDCSIQLGIERLANAADIIAHRFHRWPVRRSVRRQASIHGIDAKGKQMVELGVEGLQIQNAFAKQVPIEGFEVTNIEDDPVPLGNRAIVERFGLYQAEELVGEGASV